MTNFFGLDGSPIEELETNLRKYLGIPSSVKKIEEEHSQDELGLTFKLTRIDQLYVVATAKELIGIFLWVDYFGEDDRNPVSIYESFGLKLTEDQARDLLSDIETKLPELRSRAIARNDNQVRW
ncbi:hypothetical protein [uncultured Tateyamaria sp.]|uniref:hypothetical protein n=1 Tax=uncultured Tateyamaria sp. TaxID=455651 RepID=UPI00262491C9|nr:hypothetical protein [uncultured Tateyamaria sp.]